MNNTEFEMISKEKLWEMYESLLEEVEDYRNRDWEEYTGQADYEDGYAEGYADGHQEGFAEGYEAGLEDVMVHGEDDEIV